MKLEACPPENVTFQTVLFGVQCGDVLEASDPDFTANYTLPETCVGRTTVAVAAKDTQGMTYEDKVRILVALSADLLDVGVSPEHLDLSFYGERTAVSVYGMFSDGVRRNLRLTLRVPTTTSIRTTGTLRWMRAEA